MHSAEQHLPSSSAPTRISTAKYRPEASTNVPLHINYRYRGPYQKKTLTAFPLRMPLSAHTLLATVSQHMQHALKINSCNGINYRIWKQ